MTDHGMAEAAESEDAALPPVVVDRPELRTSPVVFASPHSGRAYPAQFVAQARLDLLRLRRSEDSCVDELFNAAPSCGAPLVRATFPRAFCDVNREKWELDPAMFDGPLPDWVNTTSARVGAGLGTIARIVASGEPIYRGKLPFEEARSRITGFWQPFHETLRGAIDETVARFGACLLVDCHSMPEVSQTSRDRVDIVLGDAHGTTCEPALLRRLEQELTGLGFRVRRNIPYAGGYITRHYGRPRENVHAVQIEICRSLYMNEKRIEKLPDFGAVQERMSRFVARVAQTALFAAD